MTGLTAPALSELISKGVADSERTTGVSVVSWIFVTTVVVTPMMAALAVPASSALRRRRLRWRCFFFALVAEEGGVSSFGTRSCAAYLGVRLLAVSSVLEGFVLEGFGREGSGVAGLAAVLCACRGSVAAVSESCCGSEDARTRRPAKKGSFLRFFLGLFSWFSGRPPFGYWTLVYGYWGWC